MKETQSEMLLKAFQRGETVTPLDALNQFGIGRLAARVHDLRQSGHAIQDKTVKVGNGKAVSAYYMAPKQEEKRWACIKCGAAVIPYEMLLGGNHAMAWCTPCGRKGLAQCH